MTTQVTKHTNEALKSVDKAQCTTRHTGFTLDQSKLTKNLIKDAKLNDYDEVINNYGDNVNLKCSSGFYLEVSTICCPRIQNRFLKI